MIELIRDLRSSGDLQRMMRDESIWNSLLVDYEKPLVQRLWVPWKGHRVCLHRIWPCKEALLHPHPWPSAMWLVRGLYEMGVGYGSGDQDPPIGAKMILTDGCKYEMTDVDAWHYVKPYEVCHTVMITGAPWHREHVKKANYKLQPLDSGTKSDILMEFRQLIQW